jgi:hypothetical protein
VLSLLYAALHPSTVRNLVTCVTLVDFHADREAERLDGGFMNVWTRNLDPADINLLVDTIGNLPGEVGGAQEAAARPVAAVLRGPAAVHRGHGDLRGRTPLGVRDRQAWPHGQAHRPDLREDPKRSWRAAAAWTEWAAQRSSWR